MTEGTPSLATEVPLAKLEHSVSLECVILSTDGVRLLEFGDFINDSVIEAFQEFGFDPVVVADNDHDASEFVKSARYETVPLEQVHDGQILGVAVYDPNNSLIAQAGQKVTTTLRKTLENLHVNAIYISRQINPENELRLGRLLLKLQQVKTHSSPRHTMSIQELLKEELIPQERIIEDSSVITEEFVMDQIESGEAELDVKPEGEPLHAAVMPVDPTRVRPIGKVRKIIELHDDVVKNAEQIFAQVMSRQPIDGHFIRRLAASVTAALIQDSKLTLNLCSVNNSKHYLVRHSINTTLLSVGVASQLGFSAGQVQELAYGALLHDIGLLRLNPGLLSKTTNLTAEESVEMKRHPVIGLNILQTITRIPRSAPMVVYQENERCDGSGYPRGRKRHFIHVYAKIVGATAAFDAMVTDRPYRKGMMPYHAMELLLKQVHEGKFESGIVRALLQAIGLFPIGSWVRLSDGSICRVVGANGTSYTRPVVSVVVDGRGHQVQVPQPIDLSHVSNEALKVMEPVYAPRDIRGDIRVIGF